MNGLRTVRAFMESHAKGQPKPDILIRDRDSKFGPEFDVAVRKHGMSALLLPPRSPNLNAFAGRLIQSNRRECLDRFAVLGLWHLDHVLAEYTDYHNRQRPHSFLGSRTPTGSPPLVGQSSLQPGAVRYQDRLGGVIKHYYRKAA